MTPTHKVTLSGYNKYTHKPEVQTWEVSLDIAQAVAKVFTEHDQSCTDKVAIIEKLGVQEDLEHDVA